MALQEGGEEEDEARHAVHEHRGPEDDAQSGPGRDNAQQEDADGKFGKDHRPAVPDEAQPPELIMEVSDFLKHVADALFRFYSERIGLTKVLTCRARWISSDVRSA